MQKYHNTLQDSAGNIITTASVYVYLAGTGTLATLYQDDEVATYSNPFTVSDANYDTNGAFFFKAANGVYDIKIVAGTTNWLEDVTLFDYEDSELDELQIAINSTATTTQLTITDTASTFSNNVYLDGNQVLVNATRNEVVSAKFGVETTDDPASDARSYVQFTTIAGGSSSDSQITFHTNKYGIAAYTPLTLDSSGNATFGGNVSLGDSKYFYLGADNDFFAVHDGGNLNLRNTTGIFYLENLVNSSDLRIYTNNSVGTAKQCASFGGATPKASLYYDGSEKLATTSQGVYLSGDGNFQLFISSGTPYLAFDSGDFIYYHRTNNYYSFNAGGAEAVRIDSSATAGDTRFMIYDVDNATLERVTVGAADSGGAGYKVLRIPN